MKAIDIELLLQTIYKAFLREYSLRLKLNFG
jgi:hypothetical protein